jgi:ribonuclease BN (tRNA processing enzyme)
LAVRLVRLDEGVMRLTVVGCGDAFGSGGRGNACFWIESGNITLALDFGATALVGMRRLGLDPNRLNAVVLSHLHGDHFGGLPFLLLDAQYDSRRERPLTVIGPIGTTERLQAALEVLYPGVSGKSWRFPFNVVDLPCEVRHGFAHVEIRTTEVVHPSGAPSTAVRLTDGTRMLAYSGDTGWTDALAAAARGADLFIAECTSFDRPLANHLDFKTIEANRARFGASRVMLTHMGLSVLDRLAAIEAKGYLTAHDGLTLDV